jgi:hypothetical protein
MATQARVDTPALLNDGCVHLSDAVNRARQDGILLNGDADDLFRTVRDLRSRFITALGGIQEVSP